MDAAAVSARVAPAPSFARRASAYLQVVLGAERADDGGLAAAGRSGEQQRVPAGGTVGLAHVDVVAVVAHVVVAAAVVGPPARVRRLRRLVRRRRRRPAPLQPAAPPLRRRLKVCSREARQDGEARVSSGADATLTHLEAYHRCCRAGARARRPRRGRWQTNGRLPGWRRASTGPASCAHAPLPRDRLAGRCTLTGGTGPATAGRRPRRSGRAQTPATAAGRCHTPRA